MNYQERVARQIKAIDQRVPERTTFWQALTESFETDGPDGVQKELVSRTQDIREKFDAVFAKLQGML